MLGRVWLCFSVQSLSILEHPPPFPSSPSTPFFLISSPLISFRIDPVAVLVVFPSNPCWSWRWSAVEPDLILFAIRACHQVRLTFPFHSGHICRAIRLETCTRSIIRPRALRGSLAPTFPPTGKAPCGSRTMFESKSLALIADRNE